MSKCYITKVKIDKLRHLKDIEIELDDKKAKHLILTGKNGVGKTTTLIAIKEFLKAVQFQYMRIVKEYYADVRINEKKLLNVQDLNEGEEIKIRINRLLEAIKRYSGEGIELFFSTNANIIDELYKQGKFILAYYGSNRETKVIESKNVEHIELKDKYAIDENPSSIFVKYLVDLKTQQSFARNENDMEVVENIEAWFNRLENALKRILDDDSIELKFDYRNYNFKIIQKDREPYTFNELSDGYSSILNIISDLILRMDKNRAGESREYGFDMEGIVLIDELETHLHIELQKNILPFLTEFFPNIQFIITTHSPFVLNSIDNAVIYDLEKNIRVEGLANYSYEGIVEGYFEVDNYSNELKDKINEYKKLVNRECLNEDERARRSELRIELKNASNDLASELKAEFIEIENKRKKIK